MKTKKDLEDFLKAYNYVRCGNTEIVLTETKDFIKLELGGHWITKRFVTNPTDKDYEMLFNSFFKFLCVMASKNIPEYETKN